MPCQCAPITRFIARVINYITDLSNFFENFTLYRFFLNTLKYLYRLVDYHYTNIDKTLEMLSKYIAN